MAPYGIAISDDGGKTVRASPQPNLAATPRLDCARRPVLSTRCLVSDCLLGRCAVCADLACRYPVESGAPHSPNPHSHPSAPVRAKWILYDPLLIRSRWGRYESPPSYESPPVLASDLTSVRCVCFGAMRR